jgi:hypothetical protein
MLIFVLEASKYVFGIEVPTGAKGFLFVNLCSNGTLLHDRFTGFLVTVKSHK